MSKETFTEMLDSLLPYMPSLMTDKYANYMCQNLFNYTDTDDRVEILYSIRYCICEIAKDPRGTHSF